MTRWPTGQRDPAHIAIIVHGYPVGRPVGDRPEIRGIATVALRSAEHGAYCRLGFADGVGFAVGWNRRRWSVPKLRCDRDQPAWWSWRYRQPGSDAGSRQAAAGGSSTDRRYRAGRRSRDAATGLPILRPDVPCEGPEAAPDCHAVRRGEGAAVPISVCWLRSH
jgi:hypothetical protein